MKHKRSTSQLLLDSRIIKQLPRTKSSVLCLLTKCCSPISNLVEKTRLIITITSRFAESFWIASSSERCYLLESHHYDQSNKDLWYEKRIYYLLILRSKWCHDTTIEDIVRCCHSHNEGDDFINSFLLEIDDAIKGRFLLIRIASLWIRLIDERMLRRVEGFLSKEMHQDIASTIWKSIKPSDMRKASVEKKFIENVDERNENCS